MLNNLSVQDFVLVERAELEFKKGFTVLTGETGAGKSMLIDALSLILGERADAGVVRVGRERAEIIAEFDLAGMPALAQWLETHELTGDDEALIIRRVIDAGGRSRAFINGRAATLAQLKEAGEYLVDIHGQHAHQSLLKPDVQRALIDGYAGQVALAQDVAAAFKSWQQLERIIREREQNAAALQQEIEMLEWQIREVEPLALSAEAWEELQAEHARLSHAASLLEGAEAGVDMLLEADVAVLPQVHALISNLSSLAEIDPALKEPLEMLDSAEIQLKEAGYALRHYAQRVDLDPQTLGELESRMQQILTTARKYRVAPEALALELAGWKERLASLGGATGGSDLVEQARTAEARYRTLAEKLSAGRQKAAAALGKEISAAMQTLAMAGGRFDVALRRLPEPVAHGLEQVEFLVASHAGMEPRPLGKVASGGELSRISLAIQVTTSKVAAVPTLIFDEVDVGIGGRVAEIVGQKLKELGRTYQVLSITHLPQVAAQGDWHWRVAKSQRNGVVYSHIEPLSPGERVEEISRMLGGVEITEKTRAHATEMLGH